MDIPFKLIENSSQFDSVMAHLRGFKTLAVDFEGEWNLHRYGLHLCLIQICDGTETFLIDPTTVGDLKQFLDIMEDENIEIISHGPQSDIILVNYLYGSLPKNVFDTEKAAQLLNYEGTSLSQLLDKFFGFTKDMKVRVSDWNKRPLTAEMLAYAAKDVAYLHQLKDLLVGELEEKGRLSWQMEECKALEEIRYKAKETPHLDLPGASKLNDRELHVLKEIYEIRDRIAQDMDKPAYFIMPNSKLVELAVNPPKTANEWANMKGVNPRLKKHADEIAASVNQALNGPLPDPKPASDRMYNGLSRNAFFKLVEEKTQVLGVLREHIKETYDIYPMILSMRNLKKVAYGESSLEDLRTWQKNILVQTAEEKEIDISILST